MDAPWRPHEQAIGYPCLYTYFNRVASEQDSENTNVTNLLEKLSLYSWSSYWSYWWQPWKSDRMCLQLPLSFSRPLPTHMTCSLTPCLYVHTILTSLIQRIWNMTRSCALSSHSLPSHCNTDFWIIQLGIEMFLRSFFLVIDVPW